MKITLILAVVLLSACSSMTKIPNRIDAVEVKVPVACVPMDALRALKKPERPDLECHKLTDADRGKPEVVAKAVLNCYIQLQTYSQELENYGTVVDELLKEKK